MSVRVTPTPTPTRRVLLALRWVAFFGLLPSPVLADGRVQFLSERLRFPPAQGAPDDFRVRTNAALALGATNDDSAVAPLCDGLNDPSDVVRQAVAVALKKLARPTALDCVDHREAVETNGSVKQQLARAREAIAAATAKGSPAAAAAAGPAEGSADAVNGNAKYYVSVSHVANNTARPTPDIDRVVRGAIASKLQTMGEYQMAPEGESNAAAKAALTKRKLKGYYLGVSVDNFDYSDGSLRVRVKIAVFSYPGKDLRGEVPASASLPGSRPGDSNAEDQLMTVVAARAAELFAQNFR
jgi:hypothetical protein